MATDRKRYTLGPLDVRVIKDALTIYERDLNDEHDFISDDPKYLDRVIEIIDALYIIKRLQNVTFV